MSNASRDKDNRKSISVLEIKLRSEIDTLRRQVTKLKKALAIHDAAAAAALGDVASPVGAETAAHSQVEAADTLPVAPTAELGEGVALARSPADAALRLGGVRVRELLRAVSHISGHLDLGAVLQGVAEGIRDALGYRIVMIRLCDAATQRLEARAFVGLRASERARLEADPIAVDEFRSWLKEDFRIGRAFLIGHQHPFARVLPEGVVSDLGDRVAGEWHPEDVLLVPLQNVDGELLGYVSVDDPVDRQVPSQETVELLEVFAGHAVVAIQNARLYSQLGEHTRQLEQANDRLQELHVLKSHFVSTISHELRTPLTAIRAYVDTLLTLPADRQEPEQTRRFLQVINEESHRLSRLIESVLDLSRFDAGAVQPRRESHNLAELVRETSELLRPIADAARVVLKVVEVEADTHVDADRDQMRQLLLHLGGNAIKFTPAGGSVVLRLTGGERGVSLFVEDTGIGIPEPELDKIFDRFYQIDSSLVRQYGGTGLGLAISRSIVESHGGEIVATSTPGKGSTFQVRLPRHAGPRVLLRSHPEGAKPSDDVLRIAVEMVSEAMDARVVSVMGLEPDGDLVIRAAAGLDLWVVQETRVRPGDGVAGWVAQNRRPLAVGDVTTHDSLPSANGLPRYRSRTFLSVPLEGEHGMLGVLNVTDPLQERAFGTEDCGLLLELAARVSRAWQKADRVDRGREVVEDATDALRRVLQHLRDGRVAAPHRVRLASGLARAMGMNDEALRTVSFAAAVHDVGMTFVTGELRARRGPLSDDQQAQMRRHVELGAELLDGLDAMTEVREIVMSHHEWWDGSGYPRGLRGTDIPVGARVLAVIDAFESMTQGRAHRAAISRQSALNELVRAAGRQFDPEVVECFERNLSRLLAGDDDPGRPHAAPETTNAGR